MRKLLKKIYLMKKGKMNYNKNKEKDDQINPLTKDKDTLNKNYKDL